MIKVTRVLIVDDSAIMRNQLRKILTANGYDVIAEAENGQDGCIAYETYRPDIVTMDINMPSMSGLEAIKVIMEKDPNAKIVVISSEGERSYLIQAIKYGIKYYILKPIKEEKVLSVFNQIISLNERVTMEKQRKAVHHAVNLNIKKVNIHDLPFSLRMSEGAMILSIKRQITEKYLTQLSDAISGLAYIRDIKVIIHNELEVLNDQTLHVLIDVIRKIQQFGPIAIVSENEHVRSTLAFEMNLKIYRNVSDVMWW